MKNPGHITIISLIGVAGLINTGLAQNGSTAHSAAPTRAESRRIKNESPREEWQLSGNAGTSPGIHFLGTSDEQPLELKVNGMRALRLEPTPFLQTVNVIGGSAVNFVAPYVAGATIAGGGTADYKSFYEPNSIGSDFGAIGGGYGNSIGEDSANSSIGGGWGNQVGEHSFWSTIAGGIQNKLTWGYGGTIGGGWRNELNSATDSFIGGGSDNSIQAQYSAIAGGAYNVIGRGAAGTAIGGGYQNIAWTNSFLSTIAGGNRNQIGSGSFGSAIAGGDSNHIGDGSPYSTILGGRSNLVGTNSPYATVAGGTANFAGKGGFAAGAFVKANHTGAFVWGDFNGAASDPPAYLSSTNENSVTMRASGGYRLFSSPDLTAGVFLAPGGGSWTAMSDRNAKEHLEPVNPRDVLDKVAALRLSTWNYKSQSEAIRHIGPMAQDFKAAFSVGETDRGITSVDADGVALAAIQGLNQKIEEQAAQLRARETELQSLKQRLLNVEQLLKLKVRDQGE